MIASKIALSLKKLTILLCLVLPACTANPGDTKSETINEYPQDSVNAFLGSCEKSGGKPEICRCALDKVRAKYTFEEFSILESKLIGGKAPDEFLEFMGKSRAECMK